MKKILSCIIILALFLSSVQYVSAETDYSKAEKFAIGMKLINEENYNGDKLITRSEFAAMLCTLLSLNNENAAQEEWTENVKREEDSQTADISIENRTFKDVDVSHPYYAQIMSVVKANYMVGVSADYFAPEHNLVMKDAVKVFMKMSGRSVMENENQSVTDIANECGALKGIGTSLNEPTTYESVIRLIYNMLDINVIEVKFETGADVSYQVSDKTFMNAVMKIDRTKGVMNDNGFTTFTGESSLGVDRIRVGNITVTVPETMGNVRDYIGRTVEIYYDIADKDEYILKSIAVSDKDNAETFDIKDFVGFKNGRISYYSGKKTITRNLASNVYMIYNGEAKTAFDEDTFDFEEGDVTVASTDGDKYDLIIVNKIEKIVVNSRNAQSQLVYSKIKSGALGSLDLSDKAVSGKVVIKTGEGKEIAFDDLKENDVLSVKRNSREVYITVSVTTVEGYTVKEVSRDDDEFVYVSDGENKYCIRNVFYGYSDRCSINSGGIYTLYLDNAGCVAWMEMFSGVETFGIVTKVIYDENEEADGYRAIKIYTTGGKILSYKCPEKIKINYKKVKFENYISYLEEYIGEPVLYKLDKDGLIESIITPESFGEFKDRGWYVIAPEGKYQYAANDRDLSKMMYYVPGTTNLFTIPQDVSDFGDEKNFSVNTHSFSDNESVTAIGYAYDKYSVIPDVMVLKTNATIGGEASDANIFVIDKIGVGLNESDEEVTIIEGYNIAAKSASYTKLIVNPECVMVQRTGGEVDKTKPESEVGPRTYSELKSGDVIRFEKNAKNELTSIRIAFDYSTGQRFNCGVGNDSMTYNASGSTYAGYVVTKSGIGVRITNGLDTLPASIDLRKIEDIKSSLFAFKINCPDAIIVVEKKSNGKLNMQKGSLDDIIPYLDCNSTDRTSKLVFLTHWSSAAQGAVIYK